MYCRYLKKYVHAIHIDWVKVQNYLTKINVEKFFFDEFSKGRNIICPRSAIPEYFNSTTNRTLGVCDFRYKGYNNCKKKNCLPIDLSLIHI